jgi:hypothetical protein
MYHTTAPMVFPGGMGLPSSYAYQSSNATRSQPSEAFSGPV